MERQEQFRFGIEKGKIFQLGFLVKNVDEAMAFYVSTLNIGPFVCNRGFIAAEGCYRGSADSPTLTIAHAFSGSLFIELIEQHTDTPSVYTEFFDKHSYGLHHFGIAIAPEIYTETVDSFYQNGFEDVFTDRAPTGAQIHYIAPRGENAMEKMRISLGAGYLECVEVLESTEEFFTDIKHAASEWDGKTIIRK